MFQTKVEQKNKTHFMFNNFTPSPPENRAVYEIMWKHMVQAYRPHLAIRRRKYAIFMAVTNARIQVHVHNI